MCCRMTWPAIITCWRLSQLSFSVWHGRAWTEIKICAHQLYLESFKQEMLHRSVNQMMCFHAGWFSLQTNCNLEFFQTKQRSPLKVSKKEKNKLLPLLREPTWPQLWDHNLWRRSPSSVQRYSKVTDPFGKQSETCGGDFSSDAWWKKRCCSVNQIWLWPPSSRNGFPASLHLFAAKKKEKKKPLCADKCIYFSYFMWRQHTDAYTPRPVYVERDRLCTHSGAHNRLVNFISHKRIAASVQNERFQPGTDVGKG